MGVVRVEFLFSYLVRQVYLFRFPTARSRPHKSTSQILDFSDMKAILVLGHYVTSLGTYNIVT